MNAAQEKELSYPAAWDGPSMQSRTDWIHIVTPEQRDELLAALELLKRRDLPLKEIQRDTVPLPAFAPVLSGIRRELHRGPGFALVRGVPIAGFSPEDVSRLYWLLGRHLGDPVPQNPAGELICSVRDTGADPNNHDTRLYTTRAEQDFHTDGADIIGLICLCASKSGGASRIVSSVRVYNEVLRQRPDLAPLLFQIWNWRLPNQGNQEGVPKSFQFPICRLEGSALSTFFIGWYLRRAVDLPGVPPLSSAQEELLKLYEATANDPSNYLDMTFEPGDIQWLKNSVILHKRTAYEDWEEPNRKRHLLRLWLAAKDFEDGSDLLRHGFEQAASVGASKS